jgi:hypothetical protein
MDMTNLILSTGLSPRLRATLLNISDDRAHAA